MPPTIASTCSRFGNLLTTIPSFLKLHFQWNACACAFYTSNPSLSLFFLMMKELDLRAVNMQFALSQFCFMALVNKCGGHVVPCLCHSEVSWYQSSRIIHSSCVKCHSMWSVWDYSRMWRKKNMRTHIWCPSESLAAFMMISENVWDV